MKYIQRTLTIPLLLTNLYMEEDAIDLLHVYFNQQQEWAQEVEATIEPFENAQYSIDGIHFYEDNHFILKENGEYTFFRKTNDDFIQAVYTISNIDRNAPVIKTNQEYIRTGYTNPTIEIQAEDFESGICIYKILTNQNEYESTTPIFSLQDSKEQLLQIEVVDKAMNATIAEIHNDKFEEDVSIQIDKNEPFQKSVTIQPIIQNDSTYQYAFLAQEKKVDDPSIKYEEVNTFEVKENGEYYVYIKRIENGEHFLSMPKKVEIESIDSMPPKISNIQIQSNYESSSFSNEKKGVTVEIEAVDQMKDSQKNVIEGGSGIQSIEWIDEKGNVQTNLEGKFQVYKNGKYTCVIKDTFENEVRQEVELDCIDTTPPNIQDILLSNIHVVDSHFYTNKDPVTISIPMEDDRSGIDSKSTYLLINNEKIKGNVAQGIPSFLIDQENELLEVFVHVQDQVENAFEKKILDLPLLIEKESPKIQKVWDSQELENKEWIVTEQNLEFNLEDSLSGIQSYALLLNGEEIESNSYSNLISQHTISIPSSICDPQSKQEIQLKVKDHAGNESFYKQDLYLDLISPYVSYFFNTSNENHIYNQDRVLTLHVQEMNFDKDLVSILVKKDGKDYDMHVDWTLVDGVENTSSALWQATLSFFEDGNYSIYVNGKDKLGHVFDKVLDESFILDKTMPVIHTVFDNNQVANHKFYNQGRHLTISIEEVNFDENKIKITGQNVPASKNWSHQGRLHSLEIPFLEDGEFDVQITAMDAAGNLAEKIDIDSFVIDTTYPKLEVLDILSQAYASTIHPSMQATDKNLDQLNVHVEGVKNKEVDWIYKKEAIENGQRIQFINLENKKENDDVYTMKIWTTDLAGNRVDQQIVFSVNRFGSTYAPNSYFQQILTTKYNKEIEDIVFYEMNVNLLQNIQVRVKENDKIRDISMDEYSIVQSEKDGLKIYEYQIHSSVFKNNGFYEIFVSSIDEAMNHNENTISNKDSIFTFAKDDRAPTISISNIEANHFYPVYQQDFDVFVQDDVSLDSYSVYINGECVCTSKEPKSSYSLNEMNKEQSVLVQAKDKAGNVYEIQIDGIVVSTNPILAWFHHKFFVLSIFGMISLVGIIFMEWRRRKKKL